MQAGRGKRSALLSTAMLSHPPIDTCPVGICKVFMKAAVAYVEEKKQSFPLPLVKDDHFCNRALRDFENKEKSIKMIFSWKSFDP